MSRFTQDDLDKLLRRNKHVSVDAGKADLQTIRTWKNPKLERVARDGALGAAQGQETSSERVLIRFVSVRKRLLDPDNLAEKWLLDCLRYCRAVRGDEPDKITLQTTQRKCEKGEEEHTEIELYQMP